MMDIVPGSSSRSPSGTRRVLCLHGFRQNAYQFREKLRAFMRLVKKDVEFEFVSAPFKLIEEKLVLVDSPVVEGDETDGMY